MLKELLFEDSRTPTRKEYIVAMDAMKKKTNAKVEKISVCTKTGKIYVETDAGKEYTLPSVKKVTEDVQLDETTERGYFAALKKLNEVTREVIRAAEVAGIDFEDVMHDVHGATTDALRDAK